MLRRRSSYKAHALEDSRANVSTINWWSVAVRTKTTAVVPGLSFATVGNHPETMLYLWPFDGVSSGLAQRTPDDLAMVEQGVDEVGEDRAANGH